MWADIQINEARVPTCACISFHNPFIKETSWDEITEELPKCAGPDCWSTTPSANEDTVKMYYNVRLVTAVLKHSQHNLR